MVTSLYRVNIYVNNRRRLTRKVICPMYTQHVPSRTYTNFLLVVVYYCQYGYTGKVQLLPVPVCRSGILPENYDGGCYTR